MTPQEAREAFERLTSTAPKLARIPCPFPNREHVCSLPRDDR